MKIIDKIKELELTPQDKQKVLLMYLLMEKYDLSYKSAVWELTKLSSSPQTKTRHRKKYKEICQILISLKNEEIDG